MLIALLMLVASYSNSIYHIHASIAVRRPFQPSALLICTIMGSTSAHIQYIYMYGGENMCGDGVWLAHSSRNALPEFDSNNKQEYKSSRCLFVRAVYVYIHYTQPGSIIYYDDVIL